MELEGTNNLANEKKDKAKVTPAIPAAIAEKNNDIPSNSLLDISPENILRGLIFSEILGRPKCKRRGR